MKKFIAAILALIAISSQAEQIEGYSKVYYSPSTNTTATSITNGPVYGKVLSINAVSTGNVDFRIKTVAGKGVSLGASIVLLNTNALTTAGFVTNLSDTVYLYGDYIVTELTSAASNGVTYTGLILVNPSP